MKEIAVFGAGCFWCVEHVFGLLNGVDEAISGYAGGNVANPSYEDVCTGNTNHAEVVKIVFDPRVISYEKLLEIFWNVHDPTQLNRQGNDVGTQYRSIIFYLSEEQKKLAEQSKQKYEASAEVKFTTLIEPLKDFYKAEDYHQQYFINNPNNPYCQSVVSEKVKKFLIKYKELLKK